jgi:2-polyprenyl-3-methyl-5-hydroxy-6-metoxy-1,4-benzoquinol methylase
MVGKDRSVDVIANPWNEYATEYAQFIARREQTDLDHDDLLLRILELLGSLDAQDVLDAGCGEGFLSRILATYGAQVTGLDLSPRLIEMARAKDSDDVIDYGVADLSKPLPEFAERFDKIGSHLVLNDVYDFRAFAVTLTALLKPGGRLVLAFNNPYSSVVREHVPDYFDTGAIGVYGGLSKQGVKAHYYHRTLEDYLDAFLDAGLRLAKLADVSAPAGREWRFPAHYRFPFFMVLAFDKPHRERPVLP